MQAGITLKAIRRGNLNKKVLISILAVIVIAIIGVIGFKVYSDNNVKADYTTTVAEKKLNAGENLDGKIIDVEIASVENNTPLGQNIWAGEHLNFYPDKQQHNLKKGQHIKFKISETKSSLGSWFIKGTVVSTK
ncbi:hypothetical protein [Convivina intestini]|uniref:hypothetical protein n=1 Tax=Convivina intestini TaxID=1505726 RepID=UPI001A9C2DCC|nr:hypothetical protein [Convivina intestini]